jgi:integrase
MRPRRGGRRDGLFQKNGAWWIDYYTPDGKRHRKKAAPDHATAKLIYRDTVSRIAKGEVLGVREEGRRFMDFAQKTWLPRVAPRLAPAWAERVAEILRTTLIPTFGDHRLSAIRKDQVEAWASARLADVSASTLNKEIWVLKNALKSAVSWAYLKASPAADLRRVKESQGRVRYLEPDERDDLLTHANPRLKRYIIAALQTGARRGELVRLTWRDVDFTTGIVTFVGTKNGDARSIPMTRTLRAMLEGLDRSTETVLPPYEPRVLTRSFMRLARRLEIKDLTYHDLRHDAASTLAMAGVPLRTISAILGHRDPRMTIRYAHLAPEHLKDAMRALDTSTHP